MTVIVGLSGYAGSGKDTAAQGLIDLGFQRVAFADKLRDFLYELNPVVIGGDSYGSAGQTVQDLVNLYGWDQAKRVFPELRQLLQRCGTDAGRKVLGENVWVNAVLDTLPEKGAYVITDVRFPNEAEGIIRKGGYVYRVGRPGVGPAKAPDGTVHVSETALDDLSLMDGLLLNDSTPEELQAVLVRFLAMQALYDEELAELVTPTGVVGEPTC